MIIKYCIRALHPLLYNLLEHGTFSFSGKYRKYHIFDIFETRYIFQPWTHRCVSSIYTTRQCRCEENHGEKSSTEQRSTVIRDVV